MINLGETAVGEAYYTYRLVRSRREGNKVRQETLPTLGKHWSVGHGAGRICRYFEGRTIEWSSTRSSHCFNHRRDGFSRIGTVDTFPASGKWRFGRIAGCGF